MKIDSKNIFCSVSAGYSSVMMAIKMREWYPNHNIINVMANTSKERKESLEFMNECDKYFGLNLIWIEADIRVNEIGNGYFVKTYDELFTDGEIYEKGIQKYGIASNVNKWCNKDLKYRPMLKFADEILGRNDYSIAIGIRADELDRVSDHYFTNNIFYPLLDNAIDSRLRNKFWKDQPIKIKIPAYKGNCDLCFKKSNRKIWSILKEEPKTAEWWIKMEEKYAHKIIETKPNYNSFIEKDGGHYFFRENICTKQKIEEAKTQKFRMATDEYVYENDLFDYEDECGSACVPFK